MLLTIKSMTRLAKCIHDMSHAFQAARRLVEHTANCDRDASTAPHTIPPVLTSFCDSLDLDRCHYIATTIESVVDFTGGQNGPRCDASHTRTTIKTKQEVESLSRLQNVDPRPAGPYQTCLTDRHECVHILPGASQQVDLLRAAASDLGLFLNRLAQASVDHFPSELGDEFHYMCYPHVGFMVAVPHHARLCNKSEDEMLAMVPNGWSFQFKTSRFVYFKSPDMKTLDERVGNVQSLLNDAEENVNRELTRVVGEVLDCLEAVSEVRSGQLSSEPSSA